MIKDNDKNRQLRSFGLLMGFILASVFGGLLPWLHHRSIPVWPWPIAAAFAGLALVSPSSLSLVYQLWMKIGEVLGAVNSKIILSLAFFIFFVPASFILRLLGKDAMGRKFDKAKPSYRVPRLGKDDPYVAQMDKPY